MPAPDYKNRIIYNSGYNNDIIKTLNSQFPAAVKQCQNVFFSGSTNTEKARAIYNYLKNQVKYKKDPKGKQLIQLPARMIDEAKKNPNAGADCKSLSLAAAAFLHCNGLSNVRLRYTSYDSDDKTPTHVYAVATDPSTGQDIIVDAVYRQFNREAPYKTKTDHKMQISVLSGTPAVTAILKSNRPALTYRQKLERLKNKVKPGKFLFNAVQNEINRLENKTGNIQYTGQQLLRYKNVLENVSGKVRQPILQKVIYSELTAIKTGTFTGNIYIPSETRQSISGLEDEIGKISLKKIKKGLKKIKLKNIFRGIKTVGLVVPRKAFLSLVSLNVRGLATRMTQLSQSERATFWKKFGGRPDILEKAINNGKKKKPLFGASKKVKAIKGIGAVIVDDTSGGIGIAPVAVASIIAASAPILIAVVGLLKKKGVPEIIADASAAAENANFPEAEGEAAGNAEKFNDFVKNALTVVKDTGIIPEKPLTPAEEATTKALPTTEAETAAPEGETTPGKINPLLLAGLGLGAVYFITKKGKK